MNILLTRQALLFFGATGLVVIFLLIKTFPFPKIAGSTTRDTRVVMPAAKSTFQINKDFYFPVTDQNGNELTKLVFNVQNAEKRDKIIVSGSTASSVKGRTFLILNLKIANDFDKSVKVNDRDYFRLSLNGNNKELLAPDIHSDPVEIQAKSTKYTRVGFAIGDRDKSLKLLVGEINKDKTEIPLNL